jgi:hypothetical protein
MTNILNTLIANQPINQGKDNLPSFTFDSDGKIKPMQDKGTLLPSRIFGSPIEYAKDLKKDIVSIGNASKGRANDHELGRINDVAMKVGSLALATYLCVKNPLKLNKAMEFVGFGTFFGSMALWPKLAIQAPLKARTGVDIHQKYIDSQDRKKMLYQDPQYVLTDLYSKEDLEKIGKKLNVSENLPDRDNFIKQRAQKTAIQGNTLWMMTAGFASPIMSALACNRLEKPVNWLLEKINLRNTQSAINAGNYQSDISKLKQKINLNSFGLYLEKNADKPMDNKMITQLAEKIGANTNSAEIRSTLVEELSNMKKAVPLNEGFVREALKDKIAPEVFDNLSTEQQALLKKAIKSKSFNQVADILSKATGATKRQQINMSKELAKTLNTARADLERPTVGNVADRLQILNEKVYEFGRQRLILDKYIDARVGDNAGSYIANQWNRVSNKILNSLKLSGSELKAVSQGNTQIVFDKLSELSSNPVEYDRTMRKLMKLINQYEEETGKDFAINVNHRAKEICNSTSQDLQANTFLKLGKTIASRAKESADSKIGTVENFINKNTAERISGAQSSFYRLVQTLDLFRTIKDGSFEQNLITAMEKNGLATDKEAVSKLTKSCQNVLMNATTTDYVEKLKTSGFNLSEKEYKTVMSVLFGSGIDETFEQNLLNSFGSEKSQSMIKGFLNYKQEVMDKVANWQNSMTPELQRCTVGAATNSANAVERNNLVGKSISNMIKDSAKQAYNSQKWLKIFGGAMLGLTAITISATLLMGKKGKTEKQLEKENKVNG